MFCPFWLRNQELTDRSHQPGLLEHVFGVFFTLSSREVRDIYDVNFTRLDRTTSFDVQHGVWFVVPNDHDFISTVV